MLHTILDIPERGTARREGTSTSQVATEEVTTCLGKWDNMSFQFLDRRLCDRQILLLVLSPQGTDRTWCLLSDIRQE